jgi:hypothetical protein
LDAGLIEKGLSISDGTGRDVSANVIAFDWAMDRHEFDLAEKHLEAAIGMW